MADIPQSLDAMQTALNFVLIEVGKAFQKSKRDGKPAPYGNTRAQTAIPSLTDRFHSALDDIEEEIIRAKAILLRDFEKLQAEKAALIEPKPEPVPTAEQLPEKLLEETTSAPISLGDFGVSSSQPRSGDVESGTTLDRLQNNIGNVQKIVRSQNTTGNESQAAKGAGESSSQTTLPDHQILPSESLFESPTEANDQAAKSSANDSMTLDPNSKDEMSKDNTQGMELSKPTIEASTTNAQTNSADIDSLFDGNNSTSNTNNQSQDADFAEIDFTAGGDFNFPTAPPANTDLDSLMPGIESYAAVNQSEDFSMLDFPTTTDAANDNGNSNGDTAMDAMFDLSNDNSRGPGDNGGNSSNTNDMGISAESNFDDLLDGMDFGDADDGTGGGDMEHGEFDEAFFGLS